MYRAGIMTGLGARLRALFHRSAVEADVDDELQYHLDRETERLIAAGMRSPTFTVVATLSLALGIGADTMLFGVTYNVLLEPLPVREPDRLIVLERTVARGREWWFSAAEVRSLSTSRAITTITAAREIDNVPVIIGTERRFATMDLADEAYYETIGVRPLRGRVIDAADVAAGAPVAFVSQSFAERAFGSADDALGQTVKVHDRPVTIIGIAGDRYRGLNFPGWFTIAVPVTLAPALGLPDYLRSQERPFAAIARLAPGVTREQAESELDLTFQRCCRHDDVERLTLVGMTNGIAGGKDDARWHLCPAVRAWGTLGIERLIPSEMSVYADIVRWHVKPTLLLFTAGVAVACVTLFGIVPAMRATRTSLTMSLKAGGRGSVAGGRRLLDRGVVVAQLALALLLVSSASQLVTTLRNVSRVQAGFSTSGVTVVSIETRGTRYEPAGIVPLVDEVLRRVHAVPGVTRAGMTTMTPIAGGRHIEVGYDLNGERSGRALTLIGVTPGYFAAMGRHSLPDVTSRFAMTRRPSGWRSCPSRWRERCWAAEVRSAPRCASVATVRASCVWWASYRTLGCSTCAVSRSRRCMSR